MKVVRRSQLALKEAADAAHGMNAQAHERLVKVHEETAAEVLEQHERHVAYVEEQNKEIEAAHEKLVKERPKLMKLLPKALQKELPDKPELASAPEPPQILEPAPPPDPVEIELQVYDAVQLKKRTEVETPHGTAVGEAGMWKVTADGGGAFLMTGVDFAAMFEEAE